MKAKRFSLFVRLCLLFAGVLPAGAAVYAQPVKTLYAVVDFMKTKPGQESHYLELEKNIWKPIHQERIRQGEIVGWMLFRIRYTGTADAYNYATVTLFADPAKLDDPFSVDLSKVHPNKNMDALLTETQNARDLTGSCLLKQEIAVADSSQPNGSRFLQVDYMSVAQGKDNKYLQVENDIWRAVHQELITEGLRTGWSVWSRIYPSGYRLDFQYLTVNELSRSTAGNDFDLYNVFQLAHPGRNPDDLFKQTIDSRIAVKSELWEIVDQTF